MKSPRSRKEPGARRTNPTRQGGSSAGVTGGVPATEEDIGTEGAGTEPRESSQASTGRTVSSPKDAPRGKRAS